MQDYIEHLTSILEKQIENCVTECRVLEEQDQEETVKFITRDNVKGKYVVLALIGKKVIGRLRLLMLRKPSGEQYLQVDSVGVSTEYRRLGIGKNLYLVAKDTWNYEIYSDFTRSASAEKVWQSLVKIGKAEQDEANPKFGGVQTYYKMK